MLEAIRHFIVDVHPVWSAVMATMALLIGRLLLAPLPPEPNPDDGLPRDWPRKEEDDWNI